MKKLKFKTPKDMLCWLMFNEGCVISDEYGRTWRYEDFNFYFKNGGASSTETVGIDCLHLFETNLYGEAK